MTPQQRAVMQQAFDAWINKCHPNGKSLADIFEPAFGMIAENAWTDAWGAALAQRRVDAPQPQQIAEPAPKCLESWWKGWNAAVKAEVDAGPVAVNMPVAPEDTVSNRREIATNPGSAIALMQGLQRKIAELESTQPAPAPTGTWTAAKDGLPADGTEVTVQMFGGQVRQVVRDGSFFGGWKQVNCAGWECMTLRKDAVTHWHPAILPRPEMTGPDDAPWMKKGDQK